MANHESWARQRVLYMMAQASTANWRIRITRHNESAHKQNNTYVGVVQLCASPHQRELIRSTVNSTMDTCMPFTYMWAYLETINTQEQLCLSVHTRSEETPRYAYTDFCADTAAGSRLSVNLLAMSKRIRLTV